MRRGVAPPDEFCGLIEGHAGGPPEGPVGTEKSHHLQYAHQLEATTAGGGRTIELDGTSLVTREVAATTVFAPMVTPRRTVLRAQIHTPSSKMMGPMSNSKVDDLRARLPVQM